VKVQSRKKDVSQAQTLQSSGCTVFGEPPAAHSPNPPRKSAGGVPFTPSVINGAPFSFTPYTTPCSHKEIKPIVVPSMNFVPGGADGGVYLSPLLQQQQQRQLQSAAAAVETTERGEVIIRQGDITVHDVLLGRGRGPNMHQGNQRYRQIIYANRDNYNKACNRTEQTRITREIVNHIKQNGRFLKRLETPKGGTKKKKKRGEASSDAWVVVDDATARLKVGQVRHSIL
jgi:hypothetical protein